MNGRTLLLAGGVALVMSACIEAIDPFDPGVGAARAPRCANQDSDPDTKVSFAQDVLPILNGTAGPVGCGCHLPSNSNPIGLEQTGLDLSNYDGLVAGGVNSLNGVFIAGSPCDSLIWQKISPGPPFGARMPFNGPPFLGEASRKLIADWIAEGALDN